MGKEKEMRKGKKLMAVLLAGMLVLPGQMISASAGGFALGEAEAVGDVSQQQNGKVSAQETSVQPSGTWEVTEDSETMGVQTSIPAGCNAQEWEVLQVTNAYRIQNGLSPLTVFSSLQEAGHLRATELVTLFDHTRPNGTLCYTALGEKNVFFSAVGENIAWGYVSPYGAVMDLWRNSPGHNANMLDSSFTHMGTGYYQYRWVQLFVGQCSYRNFRLLNAQDEWKVQKGASAEELGLIGCVECAHGTSYFPVDASMVSGYYANDTSGQVQQVTVKAFGQSQKISVRILVPLDKSALKVDSTQVSYNQAKLTWKPVEGADGYAIYRSTDGGKSYTRIRNTAYTSYTNTKLVTGKTYYYKIRAFQKTSDGNVYAKPGVACKVTIKPEKPVLTNLKATGNRVTATWEQAKGADGYELWYKTGSGSYKKARNITNGATLKTNHLNLKKGVAYTYKVRAFALDENGKRVYGSFSSARQIKL